MRISVVVFSLFVFDISFADVQAESIRSALAAAYTGNPTLNAQRAATRANDESLVQAKSDFRPTAFLTGNAAKRYSNTDLGGSSSTTPWGYGIEINQNLFNGFRTVNNIRAAKASILASRETLRNVEQNVLLSAVQAYVSVVQAKALLDIRRRNISFLREQLRSSDARLEVGEGTGTDVAQSRSQLELARAQLSSARANLSAAQASYRQTIGRNPSGTSWPRGPRKLPSGTEQAIKIAGFNHPAIRAASHAVDAALFNVKTSEGAFLPTVDAQVTATRNYNSTGVQGNSSRSAQAGVSVRVPLYQGGAASSAVRQNKQLLSQNRIQVDEQHNAVRQEVVTAFTSLQSARANLNANRAQISAARLALSGVVEERNVGQRTQLDVLLAQSSVLQAEELAVQSRGSAIVAGYRLLAAIGRLNSHRLNLHVAHYSPKKHFKAVKDRWFGLRTPSGN